MNDYPKPRWWRLYAILPLTLALLVLEAQLGWSGWEHRLAQVGVALFAIGLMALWLISNAHALAWADMHDAPLLIRTMPADAQVNERIAAALQHVQAQHLEAERTRSHVSRSPAARARND